MFEDTVVYNSDREAGSFCSLSSSIGTLGKLETSVEKDTFCCNSGGITCSTTAARRRRGDRGLLVVENAWVVIMEEVVEQQPLCWTMAIVAQK